MVFLFSLLISIPEFSFRNPIVQSNVSEIGAWTLRGSAINFKKYVRLTSLKTNDNGGLCTHQKTVFEDWQSDFSFSSFTDDKSFRLLSIYFTQELCPVTELTWNGFALMINSTNIFVLTNNGKMVGFSKSTKIGDFVIENNVKQFVIRIVKENNLFKFYIAHQGIDFKEMYSMQMNLSYGYFSVTSQTKGNVEVNDIYSISISPRSIFSMDNINLTETKQNRRILGSGKSHFHIFSKKKRKNESKVVNFYRDEIDFNNGELSAEDFPRFSDSFLEIKEMIIRARKDLDFDDLQTFIDEILAVRMEKALSKIEKICSELNNLRLDIIETWNGVKDELRQISIALKKDFSQIQKESEKIVTDYIKEEKKITFVKFNKLETDSFQRFMFAVCVIETVGYVMFFIIKRRATRGFRKST